MKRKEITCIVCPKSCQILYEKKDDAFIITGAGCPKGIEYVKNEINDPRRIFTSTVKVKNGRINMVSVRTDKPIKKTEWKKASRYIKNLVLVAPVTFKQILVKNFLEDGITLFTTKRVDSKNNR